MFPFDIDSERRRKINLGGVQSAVSSTEVLGQAKAIRLERLEQKRRQENAVRIQAWWRGVSEARRVRAAMRDIFEQDVTSITGLRCLVLIGKDDHTLGLWSSAIAQLDQGAFFAPVKGPHQISWTVLVKKACLLLLRSVATEPYGAHATNHLQVLGTFLSHQLATQELGTSSDFAQQVLTYLLSHDYYALLAQAIGTISPEERTSSPTLPKLVELIIRPFQVFLPSFPSYPQAVCSLLKFIFTIPLLPNRLPIPSLTQLSANLPLNNIDVIGSSISQFDSLDGASRAHLIANLIMFVPPRYNNLPGTSMSAYLRLLVVLFDALPAQALQPESQINQNLRSQPLDSDDEKPIQVKVVNSFDTPDVLRRPQLDNRTYKRLSILPVASHINPLFAAAHKHSLPALVSFIVALIRIWPTAKDNILRMILASSKGVLVRELYRGYIRGSPIGKEGKPEAMSDRANAASWPHIILLCDLYTLALRTMDDDEFFGRPPSSVSSSLNPSPSRNPLTLDEVAEFSKRLINVAFPLYWYEDHYYGNLKKFIPDLGAVTWEVVRESVTKCVSAIHARDSRKPFVPTSHWHVSQQMYIKNFIDAAVYEEQEFRHAAPTAQTSSSRFLSTITPCLGILNNIPFAILFENRAYIYRTFIHNDMLSIGRDNNPRTWRHSHRTSIQVRRGSVAQDGFDKLENVDLKGPIEVTFIDQFGQVEAGIDGGGLFKEFFTELCKEVFDTDRGLWLANKKNELYPNPHVYATEPHNLNWYRFIGRIVGKAMYEGILLDIGFAGFFLSKWLHRESPLDDLASLDPDLYKGLIYLKHYTGNPEDLALNYTVAIEEFGITKMVDLIPNGSNITVTRENRLDYIQRISHYRLSTQIRKQSNAFFEGLKNVIDSRWIRMFNQQELQLVIGGTDAPIDLEDLRKHTNYGGAYNDDEETIVKFWKVINTFNHDQRRALLRFVTSCSRPPLLGFKELKPNFGIRDSGEDSTRLPSSSTCVNLLKLPRYKSEQVLREKILKAIYSGAGFDMS